MAGEDTALLPSDNPASLISVDPTRSRIEEYLTRYQPRKCCLDVAREFAVADDVPTAKLLIGFQLCSWKKQQFPFSSGHIALLSARDNGRSVNRALLTFNGIR